VADTGWGAFGLGAELIARVSEAVFSELRCAPARISPPETPVPSSWALSNHYYPGAAEIADKALMMMGRTSRRPPVKRDKPLDTPDKSFAGPF
jgi:pyruvate dehydrogenase E1 component beta subunit